MKLPFLDMKAPYQELKRELDEAYFRFMESGYYVLGPEVEEFEKKFAEYTGTEFCIGVSNGLDAIHLALESGGVLAGDEVIVPANTYIATWLAVTHIGAKVVPVEPDPSSYNIDVSRIEEKITSKTKAIIAVHLYGNPANMNAVNELGRKYNLLIVEDNAQSQGAIYNGKKTGNLSNVAATSLYPAKNLGAFGEAGCITTNDSQIAEKVKVLRNYGSKVKYHNECIGYNKRIDALQSALLTIKLRKLDEWNERRRKIAERYKNEIKKGILPSADINGSVWHQFVIKMEDRNLIQKKLLNDGIPTMIHYPIPPHLSNAYSYLGYKIGDFPITESMADSFLSLPIGPHMTYEQCDMVIESINRL